MNTSDPKSKAAEESAAEDSHEDSKVEERTGVTPQGYIPPSLVVSASRDMQENLQKEFTAELFATEGSCARHNELFEVCALVNANPFFLFFSHRTCVPVAWCSV
jgi:hypothetical protein